MADVDAIARVLYNVVIAHHVRSRVRRRARRQMTATARAAMRVAACIACAMCALAACARAAHDGDANAARMRDDGLLDMFRARLARLDDADGGGGGADDTKVVTVGDIVVRTTGFHGELSCVVTLPRLSSRATAGVAFTLPRGLVADRDDVRSKTIDGWVCDAYGDVDVERPASSAGTSSVVCVKELTEDARDGALERATTTARARYGAPRLGGGVVDVHIAPVHVAIRRADGVWMHGASARGGTWKVPVGDTRDATATKIVGTVANALGACIIILAAYVRARGEKIKVK